MAESPSASGRSTPRSFNAPRSSASPFDVDIGGGQREELRRQLESTMAELDRLRLESRLKDTQLAVLVKVQKQAAAAGRVERWVRSTLSPVFHAWARLGAMEQARRGPRREAVKQEEAARNQAALTQQKEQQVAALCDRVARIKHNAQSKLTELSEANQKLAAAFEQKEKALRDELQRSAAVERAREAATAELREAQRALAASRAEAEASRTAARGTAANPYPSPHPWLHTSPYPDPGPGPGPGPDPGPEPEQAREARAQLVEVRAHAARQDTRAEV